MCKILSYYMLLTDRRNLLGTRAKSASDKSSSSRFSLPAARIANTKATEYVALVFLSVFWFSSPYRKVLTSLSVRDTEYFCVLAAITQNKFRQTTLDWEWRRLRRSFINLTEWRKRRVTCQRLIGDIKHTWKNTIFFHVCCYGFCQSWKSLYNSLVYMIKPYISWIKIHD